MAAPPIPSRTGYPPPAKSEGSTAPSRPPPSLPDRPSGPPPRHTSSVLSESTKNSSTSSKKGRIQITVMDARPMSEVGFRGASMSSAPSVPPPIVPTANPDTAVPTSRKEPGGNQPVLNQSSDGVKKRQPPPSRPPRPKSFCGEPVTKSDQTSENQRNTQNPPKPAKRTSRPASMVSVSSDDGLHVEVFKDNLPSKSPHSTSGENLHKLPHFGGISVLPPGGFSFSAARTSPSREQPDSGETKPRPEPVPRKTSEPSRDSIISGSHVDSISVDTHSEKVEETEQMSPRTKAMKSKTPPPIKPKPAIHPKPSLKPKPMTKPKPKSPPKEFGPSAQLGFTEKETVADDLSLSKPPSVGPVKATYRPTIIRASVTKPSEENEAVVPEKKTPTETDVTPELDQAADVKDEVKEDSESKVTKRNKPTIIRPKSMVLSGATSMPNIAKSFDDLDMKLVSPPPRPQQNPAAAPKKSDPQENLAAAPKKSDAEQNSAAASKKSDALQSPAAVPKKSDSQQILAAAPKKTDSQQILATAPKKSDVQQTLAAAPKISESHPQKMSRSISGGFFGENTMTTTTTTVEYKRVQSGSKGGSSVPKMPHQDFAKRIPAQNRPTSQTDTNSTLLTEKNARDAMELSQVASGKKQMTFTNVKQTVSLSKSVGKNVKPEHLTKTAALAHSAAKTSEDPSKQNMENTMRASQSLAKDIEGPSVGDLKNAASLACVLTGTEKEVPLRYLQPPEEPQEEENEQEAEKIAPPERRKAPPSRPGAPPKKTPAPSRPTAPPTAKPESPTKPEKGARPPLPSRPGTGHPLHHYMPPHALVLYDFQASQSDELSLRAGEMVELVGQSGSEWLIGRCQGKEGMFPVNFVEVKTPPSADGKDKLKNFEPHEDPAPPDTSLTTGPRCLVRFDYDGEEDEDLVVSTGDVVALIEWVGEEWVRGSVRGRTGLLPVSYVEVIEDLPPPPSTAVETPQTEPPAPDTTHSVITKQEHFGGKDELSFTAGAPIKLLGRIDNDWLLGDLYGQEGKLPASCVGDVPSDLPLLTDNTKDQPDHPAANDANVEQAVAMFDYSPSEPSDLAFNKDDIIIITAHMGDDWLKGSLHGKEGMFPRAFVELQGETKNDELPPRPSLTPISTTTSPTTTSQATTSPRTTSPIATSPPTSPRTTSPTTTSPPTTSPPTSPHTTSPHEERAKRTVTALFDFPGGTAGDLSFSAGDHIEVIEVIDESWIKGRHGTREGIFPAAFVE